MTVQQSPEYYRWLYEGGPRPADVTEEQADKDRHKVLGKPLASQRIYHPNSVMNRLTPEQRQRLRESVKDGVDIEYDPSEQTYEQALMHELDKKGL